MGSTLFKVTDLPTLAYYSTNAACMGLVSTGHFHQCEKATHRRTIPLSRIYLYIVPGEWCFFPYRDGVDYKPDFQLDKWKFNHRLESHSVPAESRWKLFLMARCQKQTSFRQARRKKKRKMKIRLENGSCTKHPENKLWQVGWAVLCLEPSSEISFDSLFAYCVPCLILLTLQQLPACLERQLLQNMHWGQTKEKVFL